MAEEKEVKGALYQSLKLGSKQIREERGNDLVDELKVTYTRKAEDIAGDIVKLKRSQKRMFDFAGTSTTSLVVKDIDADAIMSADLAVELKIHNLGIKLEHVNSRLAHLFGEV